MNNLRHYSVAAWPRWLLNDEEVPLSQHFQDVYFLLMRRLTMLVYEYEFSKEDEARLREVFEEVLKTKRQKPLG